MLLISGGTTTIDNFRKHPIQGRLAQLHIGGLITPRSQNDVNWYLARGMQWACDNDCYQKLDREAYIRMLKRHAGIPNCLWVVAPDVVADAKATLTRFKMWQPVLRYFGYPVAFVGQDGLQPEEVPWNDFECFFIGGTTSWKLGHMAFSIAEQAKSKGKWLHMGRVNSRQRMIYAKSIGCDSVDGTTFSMFGDNDLGWGLGFAASEGQQTRMELVS